MVESWRKLLVTAVRSFRASSSHPSARERNLPSRINKPSHPDGLMRKSSPHQ